MYEYTDYYDEADNGGEDGAELKLSRMDVIKHLKEHGHLSPESWFSFFNDTNSICSNVYSARSLLEWLNY
ncbi:hypothetical protein SMZ65_004337 [Cronobacter dublinensis]|nr:hypothetical protein [Cronobacter dublinensis]ELY4410044.1 hypothetical protein [Cronobacter dublinensis]ELY4487585.1 hypothetical protein [Cronobacter dublinensis]